MELRDVVLLSEAARAFGRSPAAFRKAAERGRLEAVLIGPRIYITTRENAARYMASVASQRRVGHLRNGDGSPRKRPV